jgi:hypothetical protein
MSEHHKLEIDLLPEERALLLKWTYPFDDVKSQLNSFGQSTDIETVAISPYYLGLLIGDLSHAIVKRGCRDETVIALCDRLEYIERSGDGQLDYGW